MKFAIHISVSTIHNYEKIKKNRRKEIFRVRVCACDMVPKGNIGIKA